MELKIEAATVDVSNFENKRKMIFDCLNSASEKIIGTTLEQKSNPEKRHKNEHNQNQDHRIEAKKFHGRESIFKRPIAPIAKCLKPRRTPDYQVNPHKWKKYSLSDTDTSDKSNTAAAFAFLKEIEDRKSEPDDACDEDDQSGKILFNTRKRVHTSAKFNKSIHLKTVINDDSIDPIIDSPKMTGSKVVMPEYVIGQKKERKKSGTGRSSTAVVNKNSTETLKLQHLFEEEDDDEE